MTCSEKRQVKQFRLEKDNQYLVKQIFKLATNKSKILIRLKAYQNKYPRNHIHEPIHITRLVKCLFISQLAIYILDEKKFLNLVMPWDYRMFDCSEVVKFIKSLPENNS